MATRSHFSVRFRFLIDKDTLFPPRRRALLLAYATTETCQRVGSPRPRNTPSTLHPYVPALKSLRFWLINLNVNSTWPGFMAQFHADEIFTIVRFKCFRQQIFPLPADNKIKELFAFYHDCNNTYRFHFHEIRHITPLSGEMSF